MDFKTAIAGANELLERSDEQRQALNEADLLPFLADEQSARGFFVAFLTGNWSFADEPPAALLRALKQRPAPAFSVLARNLVMSSASEAAHRRNGDRQAAQMSAAVVERTMSLIKKLNDDALFALLSEMRKTLIGESGVFADFLGRMRYSDDEKLAALSAVEQALALAACNSEDSLDMLDPFG